MRARSNRNSQGITHRVYTFGTLNNRFHSSPEFRGFGRMMLVKAFAAFKQRTLEPINKSAEERCENRMNTDREVFQYDQLKHIASYLGISDTSLSRIRREDAKNSLIYSSCQLTILLTGWTGFFALSTTHQVMLLR